MQIPSQWKKLFVRVPFLLAVFLLAAAPATRLRAAGSNTPLFLPAVTYASGGISPFSTAVADVNGDGKPDLLVANYCVDSSSCVSGGVGVLIGNGDGSFKAAVTYSSGGFGTLSLAVADLRGDGKQDLVLTNFNSNTVGVLLGNGDGTFQQPVTYSTAVAGGEFPDFVTVADVNGDGKPDLLVTNWSGSILPNQEVCVLLGNGDGTFQPGQGFNSGGEVPESVVVADVNGDGKPDLLVANWWQSFQHTQNGSVGVLLGNGDGTFQPTISYGSGGYGASSVAVSDLNSDGKADLILANCEPSPGNVCFGVGDGPGLVALLLGNGDGTFEQAVTHDLGGLAAGSVVVGNVNGDHRPDVLVGSCSGSGGFCTGMVVVLPGDGQGGFQATVSYPSGGFGAANSTSSVAVADVNGDGRPDLLVANTNSQTVGVLLNNTPFDTTPPAITLSATPTLLWPPTGRMVPVMVSGTITDTGSGVNAKTAAYAVKDEYGDVQPKGTITLGPSGNYSFNILLQASRLGTDRDGRRYIVTVRASDNAGNSGSKMGIVTVPHDQGH